MKKPRRKKKAVRSWDLPDWQVQILLNALDDHKLVLTRLNGHPCNSAYFNIVELVRLNLKSKSAPETPDRKQD